MILVWQLSIITAVFMSLKLYTLNVHSVYDLMQKNINWWHDKSQDVCQVQKITWKSSLTIETRYMSKLRGG